MYDIAVKFRVPALRERAVALLRKALTNVVNLVNDQAKNNRDVGIGQATARGIIEGVKEAYARGVKYHHEMQREYLALVKKTDKAVLQDEDLYGYLEEAPLFSVDIVKVFIVDENL